MRTHGSNERSKANIREIALAAGVSVATVSRVINGFPGVRPETRKRVESVVNEMRYIPNMNGPSLFRNRTDTLAIIIPDITNPFFTRIVRSFQDKVNDARFTVIVGNTDEDPRLERAFVESTLARRVDGIALAPTGFQSRSTIELIRHYEIPLVLLDREVTDVTNVPVIKGDDALGTELLTKHLLGLGYRRLGILTGKEGVSTADERLRGFLETCATAGVDVSPEHIVRTDFQVDSAQAVSEQLLSSETRPDAVVAANNFLALGCLLAARNLRLDVPGDLAVVSFDGIEHASVLDPFLTAVEQPTRRIGDMAADILLQAVESGTQTDTGSHTIIPPRLVVRRSCGAQHVTSA